MAWGLAVGAAGAALRGWGCDGPASVLRLAVGVVAAAKLGSAAFSTLGRWLRRLGGGGPALPPWPPPRQGGRGALIPPRRRGGGPPGFRRNLAVFALAALWGGWLGAWRLERQAAALAPYEAGHVAWVGGYVVEPPRRSRFVTYVILRAARLSDEPSEVPPAASWQALPGDVEVVVPTKLHALEGLRPGTWVAARGLVRLPEEAAYPGAFSLRRYLRARGVALVVQVRAADRFAAGPAPWAPGPSVRLRAALAWVGQAAVRRLRARLSPPGSAWAEAVGFGAREALFPEEQAALREAGLGHLLSVSGLHVGLVAGPMVAAARRVGRLPGSVRAVVAALTCAAGWSYAILTGLAAPAVRAGLMQTVALALWVVGRRVSLVDPLGLAAAGQLLLGDPALGADAGFQMSYAATFGIALYSAWAGARDDPGLGETRREPAGRAGRRALRRTVDAFGISVAAWAAVSPLVALYFGRVSLVGAVASVAAAPLSGVLLWASLFTVVLPPPLFRPAAWVAHGAAVALRRLAVAAAGLEARWGVRLSTGVWALSAVLAVALVVLAAAWRTHPRRRVAGAAWVAALVAGWMVLALPAGEPVPASVVAVPVGQGWTVAGRTRTGEGWLFVRARDGQELDAALQKAGAALAGLGVARARLAVWQDPRPGASGSGVLPRHESLSLSWVALDDAGLTLLRPSPAPMHVGEVSSGSLRLVATEPTLSSGAWGLRVEMAGSGVVLLDPQTACLHWEPPGYRTCRRDGSVHLSEH